MSSLKHIIASKRSANRDKDRESLRRLEMFEEWRRSRPQREAKRLPSLKEDAHSRESGGEVGSVAGDCRPPRAPGTCMAD